MKISLKTNSLKLNNSLFIKFFNKPLHINLLLIEASIYTLWAYLMIRIFSFKTYLKWLKNPKKNIYNEQDIKEVFFTIKKIDKYAFWTTTCYTQAIAARLIFKRKNIKSQIFLGMTKDKDGQLLAHAWTKVEDLVITGGGNLNKYKVLYIFDD